MIGDIREEVREAPGPRALRTLTLGIPIALRFHAEVYADADGRLRVLWVAALGWAVVGVVRWAAWPTVDFDLVYPDLVSRWVASVWEAAHLTGAFAAGLLAGHVAERPEWRGAPGADDPARRHAVALVAVGAGLAAGGLVDGGMAVATALAAAWLGRRGREVGEDASAAA